MLRIILASASPRRRELLAQIGLAFEVLTAGVDERTEVSEPGTMVEELSRRKAEAAAGMLADTDEDTLIIGADTVVAAEGRILGKPADREAARDMLRQLSGKTHEVYTGVTLLYKAGKGPETVPGESVSGPEAGENLLGVDALAGRSLPRNGAALEERSLGLPDGYAPAGGSPACKTFHEVTRVTFYPMTEGEIAGYIALGECMDKAGAYGIQGFFARFVAGIEGDYNNVVGLPVGRLYQEIKEWLRR